MKMGMPNCRSH